jgi:hypothetical protein
MQTGQVMAQPGIPTFNREGVRFALEVVVVLKNFGVRSIVIGAISQASPAR